MTSLRVVGACMAPFTWPDAITSACPVAPPCCYTFVTLWPPLSNPANPPAAIRPCRSVLSVPCIPRQVYGALEAVSHSVDAGRERNEDLLHVGAGLWCTGRSQIPCNLNGDRVDEHLS
jgi:hypothetical protein